MHPVIQFLSHMFGGGQPQKVAPVPRPGFNNGPPPSQTIPGGVPGAFPGMAPGVYPSNAPGNIQHGPTDEIQPQQQVDPRQIAMGHIQNMMNSYNHLQAMMPKAPMPVNGQQSPQNVSSYDNAMMNYNNTARGTGQPMGQLMDMPRISPQAKKLEPQVR